MDDGYIKFNCNWIKGEPVAADRITELNRWRGRLYELGLIGVYADGTGFGNISIRLDKTTFLITGSATGGIPKLDENHYVIVNEYDLFQNRLVCTGQIRASSESLSHAVIYESSPETNCVIHIHNDKMWERLINKVPTTGKNIPYGTPEMAFEIKRLFNETSMAEHKIVVMGGHREGIITIGETPGEAGEILLERLWTDTD